MLCECFARSNVLGARAVGAGAAGARAVLRTGPGTTEQTSPPSARRAGRRQRARSLALLCTACLVAAQVRCDRAQLVIASDVVRSCS